MAALDDDATQIERDIAETRNRMSGTLGALERKLSVSRLGGGLVDALSDAAAGYKVGSRDVADAIWRNPIPVALIGVGLGWVLFDRRPEAQPAPALSADSVPSDPDGLLTDETTTTAGWRSDPLLMGAVGIAAGAILGAMLPLSRRETEFLGDARAAFADQAEALARSTRERARALVEHAGRAAVEAVESELNLAEPDAADAAAPPRAG